MNFYKRHLGDFARDTAHLSQAQVGCYDLLLDWYYSNERPLPVKPDALHRIGRAATKAERENVDAIIAEFFEATEDGYIQKRARAEIEAMRHQRDVNREVGKRGGNPKKKAGYNEPGFLYAVQRVSGGPVKVGITKYVAQRYSALKGKVGPIQQIALASVSDMGAAEAAMFAAFRGRLDGEWIAASPDEILSCWEAITQPFRQRIPQAITSPSQNPESREEQKASPLPRSVAAPVDGQAVDPPRSGSSSDDVADPPQLELDEPPADDAVAHLRAISGQLVPITTTMRDRFAEAYPLVDVPGALRRAALWLEANPRKRPTAGGVLRFVTTWLSRDQQRAAESGVRGFQSARVIEGGRRESLSERAERLAREGDEREARSIRVLHGSLA